MDDLTTLCLLGIFIIVGFMLFSRLFGARRPGGDGSPYGNFAERGDEVSDYDNPDVTGRSAFGRDPNSGVGSLGRTRGLGGLTGGTRRGGGLFGGSSRAKGSNRVNNPEVRGRSSFGRNRGD